MHILHHLAHAVLALYAKHQFIALFGLLTIEESGVPLPVPGDMLVMLAGQHHRQMPLYGAAIIGTATAAVFVGSSLLYLIARRGGRPLVLKYGRYIRLNPRRLDRMELWFRRHGPLSIVLGRLIPGLRVPTAIMAGISDVPYRTYAPTTALAAILWSGLYFWLGVVIHRELRLVTAFLVGVPDAISDAFSIWLVLAVAVCIVASVTGTWHVARRRAAKSRIVHDGG